MDQDTADAIAVIEKQMAEKDQRIASLEACAKDDARFIGILNNKVEMIENAIANFAKGLGK